MGMKMKRLLKVSPETRKNGFDDQFEVRMYVYICTYKTDANYEQ